MAANLIGTGLGLRTRGLESGVDLPATGNVVKPDTVAGQDGLYTDPGVAKVYKGTAVGQAATGTGANVGEIYVETEDAEQNTVVQFHLGADVILWGTFNNKPNDLADADVWVTLYDDGWNEVSTPLDTQISFTGGSMKTLDQINGGSPLVLSDLPVGKYIVDFAVSHDRLGFGSGTGGSVHAYFAFEVVDLPEISNVVPPDTLQGVEGTHECSGGEVPDFQPPGLAVADDGDGSVTVVVTNNAGQTSRLYYAKTSATADTAWQLHTTTVTGNGTISDLIGLTLGATYMFMVIPYDAASGAFGVPSFTAHSITMSGPYAGAPVRLVTRKQKLMQQEVISEDRDATITRYVYACMVNATLANQGLTPGAALPGDATSLILSSKLLPARGTAEQQVEVIARKARAYA